MGNKSKNAWVSAPALALIAVMLATVITLTGCGKVTYTVKISSAQVNEQLQKGLPYTQRYAAVIDLTVVNIVVRLPEGSDRAEATTDCRVDALDTANVFEATFVLTAGIRYEPSTGEFFLTDPAVVSVDIGSLPARYEESVRLAADVAARTLLGSYAIYTLNPEDFKTNLAKLLLKEVSIEDGYVVAKLSLG